MHTFSETAAGVPAFLAKLWRLVDDPDTNNLICWSKDGRSFIIQNQAQFARELLPLNYKHNNMASFIRQLNMYGFHKITSIDNGGLKFDRDEMEFSHPCFKRNCPYLLEHIKRKIANTKTMDDKSAFKPEAVTKVLQDVKAMRGRQDSLDSRFSVMKQENEALWREIASLRQKHAKQQQIVNKLIQFLITIVQPSRNMSGVKRHMQLMINDIPESNKMRKASESESDCGPVIHELGEELLDEFNEVDPELLVTHSAYAKFGGAQREAETPSPRQPERPHSNISQTSQHYDYSNQSAEDALNAAVNASNNGATLANNADAVATASSIIQSVCPDGSSIVYHVTEVPDASDAPAGENVAAMPPNYDEDNVLTTPLVRQQMARSQLKQKNKQRRKESDEAQNVPANQNVTGGGGKQQQRTLANDVKNELNPLAFLTAYTADERVATPDPNMLSPNLSEDSSRQSPAVGLMGATANAVGGGAGKTMSTENADAMLGTGNISNTRDFFNAEEFIAGDMPANLFEDSLLSAGDNSNFNDNFKLNQQQQPQQQQQSQQQQQTQRLTQQQPQQQQQQQNYLTTSGGKFSPYLVNNTTGSRSNNNNVASTSAAAAAAAASNTLSSNAATPTTSAAAAANGKRVAIQGKNGNNMAVTKYKHEDLQLSTPDEVHGHLENVQDELNSLKDLLQSDGYSLDANTLLGDGSSTTQNNYRLVIPALDGDLFNKLFNDTDILGPYGLSLANELPNDKKGSELMTYQPMYDLSDIIDINDKNEMENASNSPAPSSSRQGSVLNTPRHN